MFLFTNSFHADIRLESLQLAATVTSTLPPLPPPRLKKDESSLTIPNVNEGDEGTYTCTVTTEIDQDSASARLTVLGTDRAAAPLPTATSRSEKNRI